MVGQQLGASVDCAFLPHGLEYTLEGPFELPGPVQDTATSTTWLPRSANPGMVPSPPRRILVVEDEAMVALQLKALLESLGHSVVGPAASLEQALALIQQRRSTRRSSTSGLRTATAFRRPSFFRSATSHLHSRPVLARRCCRSRCAPYRGLRSPTVTRMFRRLLQRWSPGRRQRQRGNSRPAVERKMERLSLRVHASTLLRARKRKRRLPFRKSTA